VTGLLSRNGNFPDLDSRRALASRTGASNVPQVYRPHGKGQLPALYLGDGNARRLISRLKWFISTCIVGAIGLVIIGIAMYATNSNIEDGSGIIPSLQRTWQEALVPKTNRIIEEQAARPGEKSDKITTTIKGLITKYSIQDSIVERRDAKEFTRQKPYTRIVASLSTVKPDNVGDIPPFNPFDLYTDNEPTRVEAPQNTVDKRANEFASARLINMDASVMAEEDSLELTDEESERYVAEADAVYAESSSQLRPTIMSNDEMPDTGTDDAQPQPQLAANGEHTRTVGNVTIAEKKVEEEGEENDDSQVHSIIVKPGDTLVAILSGAGAETWQAQSVSDMINNKIAGGLKLRAGQEVRMKMVPAASDPTQKEPLKVSIFTGIKHEATVERTSDGEYALSDVPVEVTRILTAEEEEKSADERATLYSSVYSAVLRQDIDSDVANRLLRILSYDVDFKQKVRPGDTLEFFYESKQKDESTEEMGELLYVAMKVGGDQYRYYRYRTADGSVDFYNDRGSNARKFLIQVPVKGGRFTSGFGYRRHPLLGIRKMHTGVDWAAPGGTPVMAAGNGVVEEAGRKGGNGNYVRLRHSNGYKTAYSHLQRFASGIAPGAKVRQGQVVAYVGSTGLSTGPHLHYEVLINNRFTNPQKVHVPRSRVLTGRSLQDFKKELARIEELAHRPPTKTRIAAAPEQ
jgi:murein DD-endopeptidase MepM/ murein hydrolase activator NlpD